MILLTVAICLSKHSYSFLLTIRTWRIINIWYFFIVGDSAGGNMAASLALQLRTMSGTVPQPKLQVIG